MQAEDLLCEYSDYTGSDAYCDIGTYHHSDIITITRFTGVKLGAFYDENGGFIGFREFFGLAKYDDIPMQVGVVYDYVYKDIYLLGDRSLIPSYHYYFARNKSIPVLNGANVKNESNSVQGHPDDVIYIKVIKCDWDVESEFKAPFILAAFSLVSNSVTILTPWLHPNYDSFKRSVELALAKINGFIEKGGHIIYPEYTGASSYDYSDLEGSMLDKTGDDFVARYDASMGDFELKRNFDINALQELQNIPSYGHLVVEDINELDTESVIFPRYIMSYTCTICNSTLGDVILPFTVFEPCFHELSGISKFVYPKNPNNGISIRNSVIKNKLSLPSTSSLGIVELHSVDINEMDIPLGESNLGSRSDAIMLLEGVKIAKPVSWFVRGTASTYFSLMETEMQGKVVLDGDDLHLALSYVQDGVNLPDLNIFISSNCNNLELDLAAPFSLLERISWVNDAELCFSKGTLPNRKSKTRSKILAPSINACVTRLVILDCEDTMDYRIGKCSEELTLGATSANGFSHCTTHFGLKAGLPVRKLNIMSGMNTIIDVVGSLQLDELCTDSLTYSYSESTYLSSVEGNVYARDVKIGRQVGESCVLNLDSVVCDNLYIGDDDYSGYYCWGLKGFIAPRVRKSITVNVSVFAAMQTVIINDALDSVSEGNILFNWDEYTPEKATRSPWALTVLVAPKKFLNAFKVGLDAYIQRLTEYCKAEDKYLNTNYIPHIMMLDLDFWREHCNDGKSELDITSPSDIEILAGL